MARRVWAVEAGLGTCLDEREPVVVLEAVKTETTLRAPAKGEVVQVRCDPGDIATAGQILAVVAPSTTS